MHKFLDKESVNSKLECATACDLNGVTGQEIIDRLTALGSSLEQINNLLSFSTVKTQSNDFEIKFVFEPSVKVMWVIYDATKGTWRASFRNEASTQPLKVNAGYSYSWRNKTYHTYASRSSKFEGKIFDMIRNFVDNGIVP